MGSVGEEIGKVLSNAAPYSDAITSVSNLVTGVLKRVLPEKMSEADAANLQQQLTLELQKADWGAVEKEFADRADARALAQADVAKGNWFTNVLSATVRPVFAYVAMTAFFVPMAVRMTTAFMHHTFTDAQLAAISLNPIEQQIVLSIIYFYFGGRTLEKGLSMWTGNKAK